MNEVKNTIYKLKESQSSISLIKKLEKSQSEDKKAGSLNKNINNNNEFKIDNNIGQQLNQNTHINLSLNKST